MGHLTGLPKLNTIVYRCILYAYIYIIYLPWQFGHFLFFAVFFTPVSHCPVKRVELVVVHSIPASLPGHAAQAALHSSSS